MKKNLEDIRELLIVVDMVNGFMKEGALANPSAMHIVSKQVELIKKFIKRNEGIIYIKDCHTEDSAEFKVWPPHCLKGSLEAELIDEIKHYEKYGLSIEKNSTCFMFAEGMQELMNKLKNLEKVIGVGVVADICVPNGFISAINYFYQINRNVEFIIPEDTIETFSAPNHNRDEYFNASKLLMKQNGIQLVKTIHDIDWRCKK